MQVLVTSFGELNENEFLDPRTAQVAKVDHIKQVIYVFFLVLFFSWEILGFLPNPEAIFKCFFFHCLGQCLNLEA